MKILILINSMHVGGAERVTAHLASAWAERGWDVTLITIAPRTLDFYSLSPKVDRLTLDVARTSDNFIQGMIASIRRVATLRSMFRELEPDIALGMMTTSAVLTLLATCFMTCRVIVSERSYPAEVPVGRLWSALRSLTYPYAERVVMLTQEGLLWLASRIPRAKGVVIPNPVLFPLPVNDPQLAPGQFITSERMLLLAVGRMDASKGFDVLIDSFSVLARRHLSWDLVILGEGSERPRLARQIAALGLHERVLLPGRAGNVGDWYSRADLYVMSSRFEGFPNALVEAMAYGCAAVSYDCDTGPRDIIRHEQDGLLVTPVGDVPALTRALERLMVDDAERARMATRAVEVRERYSMKRILAMWIDILGGNDPRKL